MKRNFKKTLHICSIPPCVTGSARCFAYTLDSLVSSLPVNTGKLRLREVKELAQSHTACKWWIWHSNPGLLGYHSGLLRKILALFEIFSFDPKKSFTVKPFIFGRKLCKAFATAPTHSATQQRKIYFGALRSSDLLTWPKAHHPLLICVFFFYRGHFLRLK